MTQDRVRNITRLVVAFSVLCLSAWLYGQNATSCSITGTITDATGAVVPGVQVTVSNQATGLTQSETSNNAGFYDAESLAPGDYSVVTSKSGFKSEQIKNIHLDPGQRRGLNVKLDVGSASVSVSVEADAEVVQTESAEAGGTITAKEVQNIMLNGRNFESLLTVVPGVTNSNGANSSYLAGASATTSTILINGSSDEETMYTIDGVYDVTTHSDITLPITPVVDHVAEMRVLSDNYSAKYGLAGRQVLITTKSGGEQFHGGGYFYDRTNEYGTAHGFLQSKQVPLTSLHLSDWGINLGGPVEVPKLFTSLNKKLFFFVGADWKADHYAYTSGARFVFPSGGPLDNGVNYYNGDLSWGPQSGAPGAGANMKPYASLDAAHQAILDTRYGGGAGSGANCLYAKTTGGNINQILPKCMDTNTVALGKAYWPVANYTSTGQNYMNDNPIRFSVNDELYRGDYNINQNHMVTLRIMHEEAAQINATRGYNDYNPNPGAGTDTPAGDFLLRWQWTAKPTLINVASLAGVYTKYISFLSGKYTLPSGVTINQKFPGVDPLNRIPDISMNNDAVGSESWFWMGEGAFPTHANDQSGEFSDDVSWVKGNHVLQAGMTYMWDLYHANASAFPMGNFCFTGDISGSTAGDYLMGFLASPNANCSFGYEQTNAQRDGRFRNKWSEAYFEDDWKYSPRLTLNLGVRWSYFTPSTMDGNQIANFVPSAFVKSQAPAVCSGSGCAVSTYGLTTPWLYLNSQNQPLESDDATVANLTNNGMLTAGSGTPTGFTVAKKGLFAPRIGFAYRLTNDGKTSIHGGIGMGYAQVGLMQTDNLLSNIPFVQQPTYNATEFTNPSGGGTGAIPNAPGLNSMSATSSDYRPATIRNFSLTIEREVIPGGVVAVGYAGMTTQHIFTTGFDQNFPTVISSNAASCAAADTATGPTYQQQPTSGFLYDPCMTSGAVVENYDRPYPGYAGIGTGASFGVANYNGLLLGYVQKMKNLTTHVSYTWSKTLGDINVSGTQVAYSSSAGFQNSLNPLAEYGHPDYDRPNVFVYSVVYTVPVPGWANNTLGKELLGGWNFNSYGVMESGFAQTPAYTSGLATRPNLTGKLVRNHGTDGKPGQSPLYSYLQFARPAYGFYGTAPVGCLRDPKEVALHMSVEKGFAVREWANISLGAQAFNVFNHPNVMTLNNNWSPSSQGSFGMATAYGDPREMQFYTKITF
jgi:hypothetical protein